MTDYIKRDDAIKAVANNYWHGTECECYAFAHKALDGIQSADVVPVRHGRWIKITPSGIHECSKCGKYVMTCNIEAYKYCQRCGARMDGDNNAFI